MITVHKFEPRDWPAVWQVIEPVFRAGETCAYPPDISEAEARKSWIDAHPATYVAESDGLILGTTSNPTNLASAHTFAMPVISSAKKREAKASLR